MTFEEIEKVAAPRDDDDHETAEIRAWLRSQPESDLWGLTPATRVAFLLSRIDFWESSAVPPGEG